MKHGKEKGHEVTDPWLIFGDNLGWLRDARIFPDASASLMP
jgi:hypothetical protein